MNPGDVIDEKYMVERVIGSGGMGVVVAAKHLTLGTRVALKFLRAEAAADDKLRARFLREARAAGKITGEHVARVIDVGANEATPYMVIEYLQGEDLGRLLRKRGRLPVADAVGYLLQASEAIAEAHAAGIVHRDLKPANLFLTTRADGSRCVKVLDFGISKAPRRTPEETQLTETVSVLGTPQYMSPEQVRSPMNVDSRSDIWSLGVIFYELVTGKSPFEAETVLAVMSRVMCEDPVAASHRVQTIPGAIDRVIARCLCREISARYQTVAELAAELAPFGHPAARASAERIERIISRALLGPDQEATTGVLSPPEDTPQPREVSRASPPRAQGPLTVTGERPAGMAVPSLIEARVSSALAPVAQGTYADAPPVAAGAEPATLQGRRTGWLVALAVPLAVIALVLGLLVVTKIRQNVAHDAEPVIEATASSETANAKALPSPEPATPPAFEPAPAPTSAPGAPSAATSASSAEPRATSSTTPQRPRATKPSARRPTSGGERKPSIETLVDERK